MSTTSEKSRNLRRFLLAAVFVLALAAPNAAAARPTVVTLTFDDNSADQYVVRSTLAEHSLHATFFVNSNHVESSPSYLTWSQLSDLAADGNEIGGHTLDHVDLTSVGATEAQRQVCDDRQVGFGAFPHLDAPDRRLYVTSTSWIRQSSRIALRTISSGHPDLRSRMSSCNNGVRLPALCTQFGGIDQDRGVTTEFA